MATGVLWEWWKGHEGVGKGVKGSLGGGDPSCVDQKGALDD